MKYYDWQIRFESFMRERQSMPFEWGVNDCCTFAADCVLALTGVDPALPELREHKTEIQAARLLKQHGGVRGIATAALGEPSPISMAQIGDVVLASSDGRDMLAICNGSSYVSPGPGGLVHESISLATICWRVT